MQTRWSQPAQSTGCAHISSAACASRIRGCPAFRSRAAFRSRELTSRVSSLSLAAGLVQVPEMLGTRAWKLVPLSAFKKIGLPKRLDELPEAALEVVFHQWLVAHHRHDTDRGK